MHILPPLNFFATSKPKKQHVFYRERDRKEFLNIKRAQIDDPIKESNKISMGDSRLKATGSAKVKRTKETAKENPCISLIDHPLARKYRQ
ncbi:MAG: hypothetical protein EBZ47_08890 [Chlamydiae bacterium]|nr:hypothetical protein [Chlamydiota bacterium]